MKNEAFSSKLGAQLAILRVDAGLSQIHLAEKCGLSEQTISNVETGRSLRWGTIILYAKALNLELSDVVFRKV